MNLNFSSLYKYGMWQVLLVLATLLGAFGGFPTPPKVFAKAARYQVVQWGLVFVLAYQGGAGQDPLFAAVATAATWALYTTLIAMEKK